MANIAPSERLRRELDESLLVSLTRTIRSKRSAEGVRG
jgi:hypothetical protein